MKTAHILLVLAVGTFAQTEGGKEVVVNGKTLAAKLEWIQANAESNTQYSIVVSANEKISPQTLSYAGKRRVSVRISGAAGKEKVISLSSNGSLFAVGDYTTLILDNNVALQGQYGNNAALVAVNGGGTFIMNKGTKIFGNLAGYSDDEIYGGGGVSVTGGTFTMAGGEISGNTGYGGVYMDKGATFTMINGKISGNSASDKGGGAYGTIGCSGVHIAGGTFAMEGGEISGNKGEGGVCVGTGATFTMTGGEISGNIIYAEGEGGGGVNVNGNFVMSGGQIKNHKANYGGGVYVNYVAAWRIHGTFTMKGGEISGNSKTGVYAIGTFTMEGGKISGNSGDGVVVVQEDYESGTFKMKGGEISGNNGNGVNVNGSFAMEGGKISGNSGNGLAIMKCGYDNGSFVMKGGEISGNSNAGVYAIRDFTMSGGEISGNKVSGNSKSCGGGLRLDGGARFTMESGKISGNSVTGKDGGYGGGVCMGASEEYSSMKFVMTGGEIYGNTASDEGGGVYVNVSNEPYYGFKMIGGEIYGNTAIWAGGGVHVNKGNFSKFGGTIYGYAEGDSKSNRVKDGASTNNKEGGHAVYINGNPAMRIETTSSEEFPGTLDCRNEKEELSAISRKCAQMGKNASGYNQCARDFHKQKGITDKVCGST